MNMNSQVAQMILSLKKMMENRKNYIDGEVVKEPKEIEKKDESLGQKDES